VQSICEILDERLPDSPHVPHDSLIKYVPDRPGHDRRYAMDNARIRREIGWQPTTDLESGLQKTVDWYLRRGDWVQAIREQSDYQGWLERNYEVRGEA
jgi:dTDP-glucose 4,6-dehydratase